MAVIELKKGWWKEERKPATDLAIKRPSRRLGSKYYSLRSMAAKFEVGYDSLYKAARKGELAAEVVGRGWRVTEEAMRDYLDLSRRKKGLG